VNRLPCAEAFPYTDRLRYYYIVTPPAATVSESSAEAFPYTDRLRYIVTPPAATVSDAFV